MAEEEEEKAFLEECHASGDRAYDALKRVLQKLQDSETRKEARIFLDRLEKRVNAELPSGDSLAKYHFRIHDLSLGDYGEVDELETGQKLKLLELPSIFIPEEWSFTFLEGLNRHPESGFQGRDVVELGCGNGWISIALAQRTTPKRIYGLDINPRAIKVAKINLYLNALRGDGSLVTDHEGKSLLDRVEFHVSDLLGYCREQSIVLDRIIGCIPQILNPNPEAMANIVSENAAEEFLYALSNYCGLQGFVEDQFGLGLVARAAEEGITLLRPNGAMIFNMGGRPGQAVCERLFERRGFNIKKLWQTRVIQAADTDILALVEIEKNSRHRFEFFMGLVCEEPINARTAYTYSKAGGEIAHGLSVYECRLRQPKQVKTIFKFLSDGWEQTRSALDLSFEEEAMADEKIPFLAHLARTLKNLSYFPPELEIGGSAFRSLISSFIRNYHRVPLTIESVAVLPSRTVAIELILQLFSPKLALVDTKLTKLLPKKWTASLPSQGKAGDDSEGEITVIEAPQRTDLVMQLVKRLKPEIVVTSVAAFELKTSTAFEQLLHVTQEVGARLFLDMSDHFDLSSLPGSNGVLQYMASRCLPLHAGIICGLVRNLVYSDLEVAFVLSENLGLVQALDKMEKVVCGRTPVASQFYYGCLLHELLKFQLPDRRTTTPRSPQSEDEKSKFIQFPDHAVGTLSGIETPSSTSGFDNLDLSVVDLHREENCQEIPASVKVSIFEGFARQNIAPFEMDPTPEIQSLVKRKYGFGAQEFILSSSSTALFSTLVQACVEEQGTLCFPTGSNAKRISSAKLLKANTLELRTSEAGDFKLTSDIVDGFMKNVHNPWIYISGPTITPTGLIYSEGEIISILESCKRHEVRVIIDTSSSGLEYDSPVTWSLDKATGGGADKAGGKFAVALLGVLSLELLIGGIECAYAAISDAFFVEALRDSSNSLSKPHGTLKYTVKKLLLMQDEQSGDDIRSFSASQRKKLKSRAQKLQQVLTECDWKVITPLGGTYVVASAQKYEGRRVSYKQADGAAEELVMGSSNVRDALFKTTGLYISSNSWTGFPRILSIRHILHGGGFPAGSGMYTELSQACVPTRLRRQKMIKRGRKGPCENSARYFSGVRSQHMVSVLPGHICKFCRDMRHRRVRTI